MIRNRAEKETDPDKLPGQIVNRPTHFEKPAVKEVRDYFATVNHPNFREASYAVHHARSILKDMGMSQGEAYGWIQAWASGAGDGDGDDGTT